MSVSFSRLVSRRIPGPIVVLIAAVALLLLQGMASTPAAGVVLLCYPLHPPGRSERWDERTAHWERLDCPVLLLSGDRDPFAPSELVGVPLQHSAPGSELLRLPLGTHTALLEEPQLIAETVERFVTRSFAS